MAKNSKKHKRSLHKINWGLIIKVETLALVLLLVAIFVIPSKNLDQSKTPINKPNVQIITKAASVSAQVSPTPSVKPTPAPTYYGFCLNVPILMYHHIQPEEEAIKKGQTSLTVDDKNFDKQIGYLVSAGYQSISAEELVGYLKNHQTPAGKKVVITMDDGYEDIYTYAFPVLSKYQVKASLMIPTGLLENPGYLKWDELKRMADSGLVTAYDHTWSHASLVGLSDSRIEYEILTSKKQLEEHLGKTVDIFAYPYGSENQRVIDILKQNNFVAGLSTIYGSYQCDSYIMTLHRNRVGNISTISNYLY